MLNYLFILQLLQNILNQVVLVSVVPLSTGLTRGYWRSHSTEAPVESVSSTVLPDDDVVRNATSESSVTRVSDIPVVDGDDAGRGPVSGVDRGLLGPARRRGQFRRGSYPGYLFDSYPPFPNTTIRPKRGM